MRRIHGWLVCVAILSSMACGYAMGHKGFVRPVETRPVPHSRKKQTAWEARVLHATPDAPEVGVTTSTWARVDAALECGPSRVPGAPRDDSMSMAGKRFPATLRRAAHREG